MSNSKINPFRKIHTACDSLLDELQVIWDEVGESEVDRENVLRELEHECLEVYRNKVDNANRYRAQLRQTIAEYEAELAAICSAMSEPLERIREVEQSERSLKEELENIRQQLEEMRKRKLERRAQFTELCEEIQRISKEIHGSADPKDVIETDISLRKLEEFHMDLQILQKEKSDRMRQVQDYLRTLNVLCSVLGLEIEEILRNIHTNFGNLEGECVDITDETIRQLSSAIKNIRDVKLDRMAKLQDLAASMLELWNLMDTPIEEQQLFLHITCKLGASEEEMTDPNSLSVDSINLVAAEVSRLEQQKFCKMKEICSKKRTELKELCRKIHLIPEVDTSVDNSIEGIDSDITNSETVLNQLELQIANVKEEAFFRKDLLEKVEKWFSARDEENWLEEYNKDENRFNAGRGTHLVLKRAEKARSLVNKLPGMVETLISKTGAWEAERGIEFTYDGVRLLSMLQEYSSLRQEKEEEKRRQRDQKKLQGLLITEQEALYGSKASPSKVPSVKKASTAVASNRRLSIGGAMIQTPKVTPRTNKKTVKTNQVNNLKHEDGFSMLSEGRRWLPTLQAKQHSDEACANRAKLESSVLRKPFTPVSSAASSRANIMDQPKAAANEVVKKTLGMHGHDSVSTPSKAIITDDLENGTPLDMPFPASKTPFTVSVPMQTAMTPYLPLPLPSATGERAQDEIEYSFEEVRAGFVLPFPTARSIHI